MERGEFSACSSPAALDPRDPFDSQLGFRMMYNNSQELLWRRKLEEQTELQQALERQSRRMMSLRLDVKRSNHHRALSTGAAPSSPPAYRSTYNQPHTVSTDRASPERAQENGSSAAAKAMPRTDNADSRLSEQAVNDSGRENLVSGVEIPLSNEESSLPESLDHNLPDCPFASPMKGNAERLTPFTNDEHVGSSACSSMLASWFPPASSTLELSPFKSSSYFQLPRFSTGSGAIGM